MNDGTANNFVEKGLICSRVPPGLIGFQSVDGLRRNRNIEDLYQASRNRPLRQLQLNDLIRNVGVDGRSVLARLGGKRMKSLPASPTDVSGERVPHNPSLNADPPQLEVVNNTHQPPPALDLCGAALSAGRGSFFH